MRIETEQPPLKRRMLAMSNSMGAVITHTFLILLVAVVATFAPPLAGAVENVTWIEIVYATATGNSLLKTSGSLSWNSGAASSQQITSGDGYVEFTATGGTDSTTWRRFGLSNGNTSVAPAEIEFAIELSGLFQDPAEIWEKGVYVMETGIGYTTGDVFRIAVESGVVKYYKNGMPWYTSTVTPTYPLLADASLRGWNATISNAVISGTLSPRTNCGLLSPQNDSRILFPKNASGEIDYTTFIPPAKGGSYVDPVFLCTIQRLTDSWPNRAHHVDSSFRPFNLDNTLLLLYQDPGGNFSVIDRNGNVIVPPGSFEFSGTGSEPRWSRDISNVLYYHINNQLKKTTVSAAPCCYEVVHTFTEYSSLKGGGKGDLSDDGDHFVLIGTKPDGTQDAFLYTISTDTKGPVLNFDRGYDYFDVTHDNNIIANWGVPGTARFTGIELFDSNMNFLRQVLRSTPDADRGVDLNGDEIIVYTADGDNGFPCSSDGSSTGVAKVRLADPTVTTCLLNHEWFMGTHVSINNAAGWVLVSFEDARIPGTSNDPATLPSDWEGMWRKYENELILIKLDGSQVRRLAHHRSRTIINGAGSSWTTPRAALSGDAKFLLFDSNYALHTDDPEYTDVYMIFMPALQ